jgi:multidrug transporter EmrE-like cation transporter
MGTADQSNSQYNRHYSEHDSMDSRRRSLRGTCGMSILQISSLTLFAAGMSIGQLFFKVAGNRLGATKAQNFAELANRMLKLAFEPSVVIALFLYLSLSIFWIWILSFTPLNRAYPFTALAFVFTICIGIWVFHETVNWIHLLGLVCILSGIALVARA